MEKQTLRELVLRVLKRTPDTQLINLINEVARLMTTHDLFPSQRECEELGIEYSYYQQKNLNPHDKDQIAEVAWDLITERILTPGGGDHRWPFLRLTQFGHDVVSQSAPHYYDPDAYMETLNKMMPNLDSVIGQSIFEGLRCFRRQLFFASAVMLGAAAEKAILLLLEAIVKSLDDPQTKKEVTLLLERPRLPSICDKIREILDPLTKSNAMPYSVHQSCNAHLLSLLEMIRVQRNDAVHPVAGNVDRTKVFLSLQTLPTALELIYKLTDWLEHNRIP